MSVVDDARGGVGGYACWMGLDASDASGLASLIVEGVMVGGDRETSRRLRLARALADAFDRRVRGRQL